MNNYTETKVGKYSVRNYSNSAEYWYLNGTCHRVSGPAAKYFNGTEYWY